MDYSSIQELIEENRDKINFGEFGDGVSDIWIEKAQLRLGVIFPPSFIWWLKNYKGGEVNGDEIYSVYELDFDTVVGGDIIYINELNRKRGFSSTDQLVIQKNDQGETYYLALDQSDAQGEYPVYIDLTDTKYAENFIHFLEQKIKE